MWWSFPSSLSFFFLSSGLPKGQRVLADRLTPRTRNSGGCLTQPMCRHVSAFLFQMGLRHTFVCCCEVNGYFPQGYLTAEFVCSPRAFSAWLEDRLGCRKISGLALGLPFPLLMAKSMQMKVWCVTKWLAGVQQWLRFAVFLLLGGNVMAILTLIQFSFILSFQRGASL